MAAPAPSFAQVVPDTLQSAHTAYDSIWAAPASVAPPSSPLEAFMLTNDKLFTVLIVVLIIWFGIVFFIWRTDRKLTRLERTLDERIADE